MSTRQPENEPVSLAVDSDAPRQRPDWDSYFFDIAEVVATRASCPRASIGAVIVAMDNHILATGFNGAPHGEPHCLEVGCLMEDNHCQRSLHAEVNALVYVDRAFVKGARLYVWGGREICRECQKVLKAAGITDWRSRAPGA